MLCQNQNRPVIPILTRVSQESENIYYNEKKVFIPSLLPEKKADWSGHISTDYKQIRLKTEAF